MLENAEFISLEKNPLISIRVTRGHFTTNMSHYNHYLDMGQLKFNALIAKDVAREFAIPYVNTTLIDTIFCMERTEVIGAFLAQELMTDGICVVNSEQRIYVLTPVTGADNKLLLPDNRVDKLSGKNVLLLMASITSGVMVETALDCINYYGGNLVGVSTILMTKPRENLDNVNALFTPDNFEGFASYRADDCEMCRRGEKLDGLIYSEGYRRL
ncbi:MAG: hypothetical protein FWC95_00235 [Defluviitaleaceae bacterium]|nr:hypothetical protein [Defluviitaleaceae bacterium]